MPSVKDLCEYYRDDEMRRRTGSVPLSISLHDIGVAGAMKNLVAVGKINSWLEYFNDDHDDKLMLSKEEIQRLANNLIASLKGA